MGLFDRFKKRKPVSAEQAGEVSPPVAALNNEPQMLIARLLFADRPEIAVERITELMKARVGKTESRDADETVIFSFPDIQVHFTDGVMPAQCGLIVAKDRFAAIPAEAFQQNWHWAQAAEVVAGYRYEIMLTNLLSRNLDYKVQFEIFMHFVAGVTELTGPIAIYSVNAQKLLSPGDAIRFNDEDYLRVLTNVRLFRLEGENETLMDTVGLSSFGLPDLQCRFLTHDANSIARLLWTYLYYIFENGDVIGSGNTLQGIGTASKWKVNRELSLADPQRVVINIIPD